MSNPFIAQEEAIKAETEKFNQENLLDSVFFLNIFLGYMIFVLSTVLKH